LLIDGVKSPKTRSDYEYHPLGRSKKVRTAVGRQICAAGARTLVAKEGKAGSTARRARQKQKKNPPAKPAAICESRRPDNLLSWIFGGPATRSLVMGGNPAARQWTHRLIAGIREFAITTIGLAPGGFA